VLKPILIQKTKIQDDFYADRVLKKKHIFKENYYFKDKFIDSEICSLLESDFNQSQN